MDKNRRGVYCFIMRKVDNIEPNMYYLELYPDKSYDIVKGVYKDTGYIVYSTEHSALQHDMVCYDRTRLTELYQLDDVEAISFLL